MAKRSENRNKAYELWAASKGNLNLLQIADRIGASYSLVRKWKSLDKWEAKGKTTNKVGAPYGNKNAVGCGAPLGNKNAVGGNSHAPYGNQNALKHGLYSKYIPPETLEIMGNVKGISPLDMLWKQICLQYAAILRAQKLMYVKNQDDLTKIEKKKKKGKTFAEYEYELQLAWDKQSTFLNAQSQAMRTLTNMLNQYDQMAKSGLATEEQCLRIDKLRAEVDAIKTPNADDTPKFIFERGDNDADN